MQYKKGFIKVVFLVIILVLLMAIGLMIYLTNQNDIDQAKEDLKSVTKNKAEEIIDDAVEEGKNDLGNALKETGEKILDNKEEN